MAVKFILGLNSSYLEFKSFFTNGLKPLPDCLESAYQEAAKYNPPRGQLGTHQQGWSVLTHSR